MTAQLFISLNKFSSLSCGTSICRVIKPRCLDCLWHPLVLAVRHFTVASSSAGRPVS